MVMLVLVLKRSAVLISYGNDKFFLLEVECRGKICN